jgi:AcrR family transcriptional regulator
MSDFPAAATPKQARSKKTREKIIQAAIDLFEELGYEKTNANEIAAAAGVSVGSVYVYFADKRQLLLTIFDRLADDLYEVIFDGLRPEHLFDEELRPRIRSAIAKAIDDRQKHAGLHRVIAEMMLRDAEFAEKRKSLMERSIGRIHELISLANKAGLTWHIDVDAASFVVQRVVNDLAQDYVTGFCDFDKDRAVDALTEMIYRYLFKAPPP